LSELIAYAPIDRIVTETDAPFLTPEPHRGSRNEPSYVIIVGNFIAKVKNSSFEKINTVTSQNAEKIFKL
jgi:TatD DNase family protein